MIDCVKGRLGGIKIDLFIVINGGVLRRIGKVGPSSFKNRLTRCCGRSVRSSRVRRRRRRRRRGGRGRGRFFIFFHGFDVVYHCVRGLIVLEVFKQVIDLKGVIESRECKLQNDKTNDQRSKMLRVEWFFLFFFNLSKVCVNIDFRHPPEYGLVNEKRVNTMEGDLFLLIPFVCRLFVSFSFVWAWIVLSSGMKPCVPCRLT